MVAAKGEPPTPHARIDKPLTEALGTMKTRPKPSLHPSGLLPQANAKAAPPAEAPKANPPLLNGVILVSAGTAARMGEMGESWWWGEVREGRAPAPAIRQFRMTRWRMEDVRKFWETYASNAAASGEAERTAQQAHRAAAASARKRRNGPASPAAAAAA